LLALDVALATAPALGLRCCGDCALCAGLLFALQLVRRNMRRLIWRLRNRLIVAYLFIAFVTHLLIAIWSGSAGGTDGQTRLLVSSERDRRTRRCTAWRKCWPRRRQANGKTPSARWPLTSAIAFDCRTADPRKDVYRYPEDFHACSASRRLKHASGLHHER